MNDAQYLGETIEWKFASEEERKRYVSPGQSSAISSLFQFFLPLGFMIATMLLRLSSPLTLILVGMLALLAAIKVFLGRKARLAALELRLHSKRLVLVERYENATLWKNSPLSIHAAKSIRSLAWVSNGCHIEFRGGPMRERSLVLPLGLFSTPDSIAALYNWAQHHGMTIEGPRPLPSPYVRPIE